jgi:hypothetical protein
MYIAWLLCQDKPRIPKYPYESAPQDWSFLNLLPVGLQHVLTQWLGNRILQLNTGSEYFPDQFLVGGKTQEMVHSSLFTYIIQL